MAKILIALLLLLQAPLVLAQQVEDREVDSSGIDNFDLPSTIDEADLEMPEANEFAAPLPSEATEPTFASESSLPPALPGPAETYRRPVGPKQGGKFKIQHPGSADGLLKIGRDGYQYKVPLKEKSQATSFRAAGIAPPNIESVRGVSFQSMYGGQPLSGLLGEYEWMPFRGFGALGIQLGFGLVVARGNGRINIGGNEQPSAEIYTLFVVPMSALAVYRFEYFSRQWFVPFVNGGATYFALAETRDDNKPPKFAGAPAAVFGGGIHIGVSRWDLHSSFILSKDYGVSDVWLTLEARVIAGLRRDLNFSSQAFSAGFTIDY